MLNGVIRPDQINIDTIAKKMSLSEIPEPDLLIRTGGEKRLSNYLLWQLAYTELYFTEKYWPEFDVSAFEEALIAFSEENEDLEKLMSKFIQKMLSLCLSETE